MCLDTNIVITLRSQLDHYFQLKHPPGTHGQVGDNHQVHYQPPTNKKGCRIAEPTNRSDQFSLNLFLSHTEASQPNCRAYGQTYFSWQQEKNLWSGTWEISLWKYCWSVTCPYCVCWQLILLYWHNNILGIQLYMIACKVFLSLRILYTIK